MTEPNDRPNPPPSPDDVEATIANFEASWRQGESAPAEAFISAGHETFDLVRRLVETEIQLRRHRGEQPTQDEYLQRFSQWPEAVRAAFQSLSSSADAPPTPGESSAPGSEETLSAPERGQAKSTADNVARTAPRVEAGPDSRKTEVAPNPAVSAAEQASTPPRHDDTVEFTDSRGLPGESEPLPTIPGYDVQRFVARGGPVAKRQHLPDSRRRRGGRPALHLDGLHRRPNAQGVGQHQVA